MKKYLIPLAVGVVFFLIGYYSSELINDSSGQAVKRERISMGTVVEIIVKGESQVKANEAINKAFEEIERINDLFSTYLESSEVTKINRNDSLAQFIINKEFYFLLSKCEEVYYATEGAFDAATGNLIELWDFTSDANVIPEKTKIENGLRKSGWENIRLLNDSVLIMNNRVSFNFGAIAKGYGVDRAAKVLNQLYVENYLINAGGDIKVSGAEWKIAIQHPRKRNESIQNLLLQNVSVATSGDYEQYFEKGGKRYHHILDPKTGYPPDACQSVTVIAKDCISADAYATGIFVLGVKEGMKVFEKNKEIEGMIINSSGTVFTSSGFNKYVWREN